MLRHRGTGENGGTKGALKQKRTVGLVTTDLETLDSQAQMVLHLTSDKKDAMQMVGHQLKRQHLDGGAMVGDCHPAPSDFLSQR